MEHALKDFLKKILEDGAKADGRLSDLQNLLEANRDRDFIGPVPEMPTKVEKDPEVLKDLGFTEEQIRIAQEQLPDDANIDPDQWKADWKRRGEESHQHFLLAVEIMRAAALEFKGFAASEEKAAGELKESFAPDTDLGDLLLIALGDDEALSRFADRHPQPIHRARWPAFRRDFNTEIQERMDLEEKSREDVIRDVCRRVVLFSAGHILRRGWRTSKPRGVWAKVRAPRLARKPLDKAVDVGQIKVLLREPTPPELFELVSGDAATLDDRILEVSVMGAGAVRPKSPEEIKTFLSGMRFSPAELGLLLREARAFITECLRDAVAATFQMMNDEATKDLLGGMSRREAVAWRRAEPGDRIASQPRGART